MIRESILSVDKIVWCICLFRSFDSLLRLRLEYEYVTSSHRIASLKSSKLA
jgi:hypothetical protein